MPLTLVTGPANAAKAGVVFERMREKLADAPLLVVPTPADAEHYQREVAASGLVFGAEVVTFNRLAEAIAERAGLSGRRLGPVARERVLRAAIADVALDALAASAAAPGFVASVTELVAELQRNLVTPARLSSAVAAAEREQAIGRRAALREVVAVYRAYRRRLARLDAHDPDGRPWAALDALRADPAAWGARPVLFYGFDDLTRVQLDAVETLVRNVGADVLVTLPYEPGRAAFAGRATTVQLLTPLAGEHVRLPERSEHYLPAARTALHHLERHLFEPDAPVAAGSTPGVVLLEAGGERAEGELVAAEVLSLVRAGTPCDEIAILAPAGARSQELMASILEGYGLPVARARRTPLTRTRLGAGLAALARVAEGRGSPGDLLRWLRTPGRIADRAPADRLEALVRREGIADVRTAVGAWAGDPGVPAALDAVTSAAQAGPIALLKALLEEARGVWMQPHRRGAPVFDAGARVDAEVVVALQAALGDLRHLADADARLLAGPETVEEVLSSISVDESATDGGVLLAGPLDVRARRFRAVFATGLQDGALPRRPVPDPFLDDDDRRALARASGLVLPLGEEALAGERYLFYSVCSRPQEHLGLSWCSSTEEGDPLQPSSFLADVRALFDEELWHDRRRRLLAEVTWPVADAPTDRELRRALAARERAPDPSPLAAPVTAQVRERLAAREHESARALETFASCGVAWLVESVLRPQGIDPDAEPLWRGTLAHSLLEQVVAGLGERSGSARLTATTLAPALELLAEAVRRREREGRFRGVSERVVLRAVHADLARYLREEAEHGEGFEPVALEWSFGRSAEEAALTLDGGLRLSGRVDRIDAEGGRAIVRDYKHRNAPAGARWAEDRKLQVGLYALAVRELLGLKPVAALYQPLAGTDLRPRGVVSDELAGRYVGPDVLDEEAFATALADVRAIADEAARRMRSGAIAACPSRCSTRGCRYPAICRSREASPPAPGPEAPA